MSNYTFSTGIEVSGSLVTSTLLISDAVLQDAGHYSCTLPLFSNKDFPRARATVHVIYGIRFYNIFTLNIYYLYRGSAGCAGGCRNTEEI